MTIRPVEAADLPALGALEAACFGADAWSVGQVLEELSAGRSVVVLTASAEIIGYASVSVVGEDAELLRIAVDPAHRRQGFGRALLTAGVEAAGGRGARRILLEVDSENSAAIELYTYAGFRQISRRRGYYRGRDAVVMERGVP